MEGRRTKTFQSILGPLELERAYYHCRACGHGFCPRDDQLDLQDTSLSPAVTRMTGTVRAMVSFEEGSRLLQQLAGVPVDAKQVKRAAKALGAEVAADEKQDLAPANQESLPLYALPGCRWYRHPDARHELQGRSGKQADGSAKTREVKLCTVWSAEARDEEGRPVRDPGSVTYTAALESASTLDTNEVTCAFTQRVLREAGRRRFTEAARTVVIGDGAAWIWKIAHELFPHAIQIVDRFHVKEHLSNVGKAIYRPLPGRPQSECIAATNNWTEASCRSYCAPSVGTLIIATRRANACNTSKITARAWIIPTFTNRVCAHLLAWLRLQSRHRHAMETRRDALDRARLPCDHYPLLLQTQRTLRRLLGASLRTGGRMIPSPNPTCTPYAPTLQRTSAS